ncbi:putative ribonuclease H-like domain-containing protein [Tanacetum coccineum]|uniref:Ribonuclease H-like domain-containing protein n=1 Tax=Tanacetum coccineum TaxID=301880 RepID=A0ABQ4WYV9_9ASTR
MDRGYAGRASTIQVKRSLDFDGITKWKKAIGTKWVFRNKKDERGIVIRNKARSATQGYTQEEGINYDEVFAHVARIEAIRLFLAYASFKDFMVYQIDVKSAFLYRKIEEEVYVCQPPGFKGPDFPDRVYKVEKALNELHQAPKAWYETLSTYLLDNRFQRGKIDKTLFIKRFTDVKTASTPMETQKPLLKDKDGEEVDVHIYKSIIGSLMYLTSSRPDIMFAVCACARYQVNPKVSHLHAVKMMFRYLKGQPKLGLWYPKDSPFDLVAYTDSDYVVASFDKKSTTGSCQFLRCRLISWQCKKQIVVANSITEADAKTIAWNEFSSTMASAIICLAANQKFNFSKYIFESMVKNLDNVSGKFLMNPRLGKGFFGRVTPLFPTMVVQNQQELGEGSAIPTDPHHTTTIIKSSTQPQKTQKPRKPKIKDTRVPQPSGPTDIFTDEVVNKELGDSLVRAASTASSIEAEQDNGNITKTRSKATLNEPSSP